MADPTNWVASLGEELGNDRAAVKFNADYITIKSHKCFDCVPYALGNFPKKVPKKKSENFEIFPKIFQNFLKKFCFGLFPQKTN